MVQYKDDVGLVDKVVMDGVVDTIDSSGETQRGEKIFNTLPL